MLVEEHELVDKSYIEGIYELRANWVMVSAVFSPECRAINLRRILIHFSSNMCIGSTPFD